MSRGSCKGCSLPQRKRSCFSRGSPGILSAMEARGWRVGVLREMPPEGKVGVSPVCVLGLNINQGEEIRLRLRTDDLKGFRRYKDIRDTLCHELAHNVHADHGDGFKALNSELLRECSRFDRHPGGGSNGRTIGGGRVYEPPPSPKPPRPSPKPHVLRDHLSAAPRGAERSDPLAAAAAAAEARRQDSAEASLPSGGGGGGSPPCGNRWPETGPSAPLGGEPGVTGEAVAGGRRGVAASPPVLSAGEPRAGTEEAEADRPCAGGSGGDGRRAAPEDSDPTAAYYRKAESLALELKRTASPEEAAQALSTLAQILSNALQNPGEEKYRRLRCANEAFRRRVGRFGAAVGFLTSAGFAEAGGGEVLYLARDDPALLWLARRAESFVAPPG
uniref:Ubiquitin and wlm domain-containing protein n=1 Tax=Tetraselmis sp. GSL018 TaxID=582737 RepID=A0A061REN7_9CHLO